MAKPKDLNHPDLNECSICGAPLHECQCGDPDPTQAQDLEAEEDWRQYLK